MSSTTGFLTLSIHEALTFHGSEIVIHPNLFAAASTAAGPLSGGGGGAVRTGTSEADDGASVAQTQPPNGGGGVVGGQHIAPPTGGGGVTASPLLLSPGTASVMSTATHQTATKQNFSALAAGVRLEAGDLIEIRVWDAKPCDGVVARGDGNERGAVPRSTAATVPMGVPNSRIGTNNSGAVPTGTSVLTTHPPLPPKEAPSSWQVSKKPSSDGESVSSDQLFGMGILHTTPTSLVSVVSNASSQAQTQAQQKAQVQILQPQLHQEKGQQQHPHPLWRKQSPPDSPATSLKTSSSVAGTSSDSGSGSKAPFAPNSAAAANAAAATLLAAAAASSSSASRVASIPMRRDEPRKEKGVAAIAVEPRDIRAPRLSDSPSPPLPTTLSGRKAAGGPPPASLAESTNPQDGGGSAGGKQQSIDSAASSLSSSPVQRSATMSSAGTATSPMPQPPPPPAPMHAQLQSVIPPSDLPPRVPMPRNRSFTADSTGAHTAPTSNLPRSSSASAAASTVAASSAAKPPAANRRHVRSSSSATLGTMPSMQSGTPAGSSGGSTLNVNSWKNWGQHGSQPKHSTAAPPLQSSQPPLPQIPRPPAGAPPPGHARLDSKASAALTPIPGPIGTSQPSHVRQDSRTSVKTPLPGPPGHVRHDSKLSVTSIHVRQSSTASSALGEQLVSPSLSAELLEGSGSGEIATQLAAVGVAKTDSSRNTESDAALANPAVGVGVSSRPPPHTFARMPARITAGHTTTGPTESSTNAPPTQQPKSYQQHQTQKKHQQDMLLDRLGETHDLRMSFVMVVSDKTLTSVKTTARTQVSILRQVADLYDLSSFDTVTVTKVHQSERQHVLNSISADFVTVTIKDQFISRGEMYLFQRSFISRWIYEGERLDSDDGVRANAMEIRHANRTALSGIVTENTKITFRTRSARIIWLVQVSADMWDYSSPYEAEAGGSSVGGGGDENSSCDIYFDKFVSFMYRLFEKWKDMEVSHSLTVVFFSRTYLKTTSIADAMSDANSDSSAIRKDCDGRLYEDHYKMVIENETRTDWSQVIQDIKKAFVCYPVEVGWDLSHEPELGRVPSTAAQGNLLEAINITLNLLQFHYMDRDLHRVGNSVVVISAGCGVFEVNKGLASITKQRMMDNGIGSDMLSLGLPPLHVAPFFLYKDVGRAHDGNGDFDDWKTYFEIPHWMHLSYVSYDGSADGLSHQESSLGVSKGLGHQPQLVPVPIAANGFMVRDVESGDPVGSFSEPVLSKTDSTGTLLSQFVDKTNSQKQQRHLISGREFEDILEACRPRNRGEFLPSSLVTLIQKSKAPKPRSVQSPCKARKAHKAAQHSKTEASVEEQVNAAHSSAVMRANESTAQMHLQEWGAVSFDEACGTTFLRSQKGPPKLASSHKLPDHECSDSPNPLNQDQAASGSEKSSPSSSFASYSFLLGRSPEVGDVMGSYRSSPALHGLMLQPSLDIDIPLLTLQGDDDSNIAHRRSHQSGDSLSTMCSGDVPFLSSEKDQGQQVLTKVIDGHHASPQQETKAKKAQQKHVSVQSLQTLMSKYDTALFLPAKKEKKKTKLAENNAVSAAPLGSSNLQDHPPVRVVNARGWNVGSQRLPEDAEGGTNGTISIIPPAVGIGAALVQHSVSARPAHPQHEQGSVMMIGPRRPGGLDRTASATSSRRCRAGSFDPLQQGSPVMTSLGMPMGFDPGERIRLPSAHPSQNVPNMPNTAIRLLQQNKEKGISIRAPTHGFGHSTAVGSLGSAANIPPAGTSSRNIRPQTSVEISVSPPRNHVPSPKKPSHRHGHHHHHRHHGNGPKEKSKKKHTRRHLHSPMPPSVSTSHPRRKAWVLNPFRQQDEEEVLAKRTHNRRRWSHVFPLGEAEFKRHAGPNWKSLCHPAILPATIDYFPSKEELSDPTKYQFSHYEVMLDAMDRTYYNSHSALLREMVTQRLIQDYQIVPQNLINQSANFGEMERKTPNLKVQRGPIPLPGNLSMKRRQSFSLSQPRLPPPDNTGSSMQWTLSMGHRIHSLSYIPSSDSIQVLQYVARFAQNVSTNIVPYKYLLWCPARHCYTTVVQKFSKYSEEYMWNRVDNLICGDKDKKLTEGTRFRRIMFRIIPENFTDAAGEQEYVKKFQGLLEYLSKKLLKEPAVERDIKIVTTSDPRPEEGDNNKRPRWRRADPFKYFTIQLNKGTDHYQWMEWVMDAVFDTQRTYKIMLHWLVANAVKVEAQVNLLQRRCSQFGLRLVAFPQGSISTNVYLHPFVAPIIMPVHNNEHTSLLEKSLVERFGFIDDGSVMMDPKELDGFNDYTFPVSKFRRIRKFSMFPSKQVVHKTGTIFVRVVRDEKGWGIFILHENRRYICNDDDLQRQARGVISEFRHYFSSVTGSVGPIPS